MSSRLKFATLGAAVVVLAYGAASWYAGRLAQQSIQSWVDRANQEIQSRWDDPAAPGPKLALDDYQRGIFTSQVRYVFEYRDADGAAQRLVVQDALQHGPWPAAAVQAGIWRPLAAYSRLQPVADGPWKPWFDRMPDAQAPWHAVTQVGFDGRVDSLVTVLPVRIQDDGLLDFSGGTLAIHHEPGARLTQVSGQAQALSLETDDASKVQLRDIQFQGRSTRSGEDGFQSTQEIQLASVQLDGTDMPGVRLDQPSARVDVARTGSLMDAQVQYDFGKLLIDRQDMGVIQLKASSQQLDVDAVQALGLALGQLPDDFDYDQLGSAEQQALKTRVLSVLATSPVLSLDSLSWATPKGKTDLRLRVQLRPVADPVPDDPGALIERGIQQVKFGAGVSKPMLVSLLAQLQSSNEGAFGAALFSMLFDQYADRLQRAGLAQAQDGQMRTEATYADGLVSVNGQAAVTPEDLSQQLAAVLGLED
ncbi:YdgA family protein [Castellaniella hirudinis]|uniref:YdgA family protein n=1 Tax=Castellaniella hirudinis TaxID=1144617 RepID=UPI0039C0EBD5